MAAAANDERLVFRGGLVFDGTGTDPFRADIAVVDGTIVEVGAGLEGARVIDVAGRTVLPGLIDCHAHVALTPELVGSLDEAASLEPSYLVLTALANLRATLDAGVTTVRDGAGADAGLRRAVAEGIIPGPRLLVSLLQLSPSAGPSDERTPSGLNAQFLPPGLPSPLADGPDALRAKVREYVHAGADVIKIFATGHFSMPRDGARRSLFTDAELVAIVDEATRQGVRVMAHAHGSAGATAAARAGVASIEHGYYLDETARDAMLAAGTTLVPTLLASAAMLESDDEGAAARARTVVDGHRQAVREAHRRGIPIAMGTDCPVTPHGRNAEELALMVECGLTPKEALAAATSVAAGLLGLETEIGRVAPGLHADLLILEGESLDVAGMKSRIRDVYQRGVRVGPSTRPPD